MTDDVPTCRTADPDTPPAACWVAPSGTKRPRITAETAAPASVDDTFWSRVLAAHTRDERGYCSASPCRHPDTGEGSWSHPCPSRSLAFRANRIHTGETHP